MLIRQDIFVTNAKLNDRIFHADLHKLLEASIAESIGLCAIDKRSAQFSKRLMKLAEARDIKTKEDRDVYFDRITKALMEEIDLIKAIDQIYVISPVFTEQGRQFLLTEYGSPIISDLIAGKSTATIDSFTLPISSCKVSVLPAEIKKCRSTGNLHLLNTKQTFAEHIFLLEESRLNKILALVNGELDDIQSSLLQLDERFGSYTIFPNPFMTLLFGANSDVIYFERGFDDLLDEIEMSASLINSDNPILTELESLRHEKKNLSSRLNQIYSRFNKDSLIEDMLKTLKLERPESWRQDLKEIGIDGIAYSSDISSINAVRGNPLPDMYELFNDEHFEIIDTIEADYFEIQRSKASILHPIIQFKTLAKNIMIFNDIFTILDIAKHTPMLLLDNQALNDRQKGLIKFFQLDRLDASKLPTQEEFELKQKQLQEHTLERVG